MLFEVCVGALPYLLNTPSMAHFIPVQFCQLFLPFWSVVIVLLSLLVLEEDLTVGWGRDHL
jgi:hypothetical protein